MNVRLPVLFALVLLACDSPGGGGGGKVLVDVPRNDTTQGNETVEGQNDATNTTTTDPEQDTFVTSPADTTQTTTFPDVTTSCTPLDLEGTIPGFMNGGEGNWSSPQVNLVGGAAPDVATLVFDSNSTGSFSLVGQMPSTCDKCLSFFVDIGQGGQQFFASEGDMVVSAPPFSQLDVTLSDVRLTAVNGSNLDFGGPCYSISQVRLTGEGEQCEANCSGKECGTDGCGGSCGTCSGSETCNASGQCVGGSSGTCTPVTVTGSLAPDIDYPNLYSVEVPSLNGFMTAEFFTEATGTFQLTSSVNSNYATCEQCILLRLDDNTVQYFQTKGSLTVSGTPLDGDVGISLSNVEVREVTIEEGTFQSTLVSGGACYKINNTSLSSQ